MKPLAGVFLALACVLGIASTGCVFELAYGEKRLGHLYVFRDSAPVAGSSPTNESAETEQIESSMVPSY